MKNSASRKIIGKVVSDAMQKTAVVAVDRYLKHPQYRKFVKVTKKYKAHDEKGEYNVGDKVIIEEQRPISKDKRFRIVGKIS